LNGCNYGCKNAPCLLTTRFECLNIIVVEHQFDAIRRMTPQKLIDDYNPSLSVINAALGY